MSKKTRKQELVEQTLAFKLFGKRYADLTVDEMKEYRRIKQKIHRENNPTLREKETLYMREWRNRRKNDGRKDI